MKILISQRNVINKHKEVRIKNKKKTNVACRLLFYWRLLLFLFVWQLHTKNKQMKWILNKLSRRVYQLVSNLKRAVDFIPTEYLYIQKTINSINLTHSMFRLYKYVYEKRKQETWKREEEKNSHVLFKYLYV